MRMPMISMPIRVQYQSIVRRVTCVLLASAIVVPAFAQSGLTGYWNFRSPNGDGTYRETFFQLEQNGENLSGKWLGRDPSGIPIEGTIKGDIVHFATVPPPPQPGAPAGGFGRRPVVYDGTFHDGKMTLTSQGYRSQNIKGDAERTTRAAAMPPAPLPLPALKNVPDNGLVRTPPMGWNSWNKFAGRITDKDVREMADAMVASGMSKLGYVYINIDDTWEAGRDAEGNILTNTKFPDMKGLVDYVHSKGLKIGIYSSPGPKTCAGYTGSFGHEIQDAKMYAKWGIDYLKYDLCSARNIYSSTEANHRALYQKMGEALQSTGRPIVFSLCQYGENAPWKWGTLVGGNLWRTTGDIRDAWDSMDKIGFSQLEIASYTRPGHWNDPDMLEIGNGGMNADEYRTHMSLWSMLSAPLIAGNDIRNMSEETKSILMNTEVIAVDQDPAALPTKSLAKDGSIETLVRKMKDGSFVVGIFNRSEQPASTSLSFSSIDPAFAGKSLRVRDLWKHENVSVKGDKFETSVPRHGVVLLRVSK